MSSSSKDAGTPEKPRSERREKKRREGRAEKVVFRNIAVTTIYRRLLALAVVSSVLAVVVVGVALSIATRKVPPQYIPVTEDGRLISQILLTKPNVDHAGVFAFSLEALKAINTYDYINYRDQFDLASRFFTQSGWNEYLKEYEEVSTIRAVTERKMIVSATPTGPARVVREGIRDGVYQWEVEVPAVINYVAHVDLSGGQTGSNQQKGHAKFFITRIPGTLNQRGLAVREYGFLVEK